MKNLIRIVFALLAAALLFIGQSGVAFAQTGGDGAQNLAFDHNTTGFMLDTTHRLVQCDTCHTSGVFRGTPRTCAACHAGPGARAPGKTSTHIPTTAACDACHRAGATSWAEKPTGFTQGASGHPINPLIGVTATNCITCHNGSFAGANALMKPPMHIQTFEPCSTCHLTTSWLPATNPHAGGVNGRCANCHNGVNAKGKTPRHIPTSASCDTCHNNFLAFTPSVMNHTGLNGQCSTCHTGAYESQNAQSKTATHVITTAQCDTCHNSTTTWATGVFDHAAASPAVAGRCSTCHNGTNALGRPNIHVPSAAQCDTCHSYQSGAFKPAQMNHSGTAGQCATCHNNGTYAFANALSRSGLHIQSGAVACDSCHTLGFVSWTPAVMNHTGLDGKCSSCHSGGYLPQNAQTKPATHISTTAQCDTCHHSTTTWANGVFDHSTASPAVAGRCSTCHNGTNALGKSNTHILDSRQCDTCHQPSASFASAVMDHTGTAGKCSTCHNGGFTSSNALGLPKAGHIPTQAQCDACHVNGFVTFAPAVMNHTGLGKTCDTCHGGAFTAVNAMTKPSTHVSTTAQCDTCHASTTTWTAYTYTHDGSAYGNCSNCHGNGISLGKPANHIPAAAQCDSCHFNFVSFKPASFTHTSIQLGTNSCGTCHGGAFSGVNAQPKPATHIQTQQSCEICHGTTAWKPVVYAHPSNVAGTCSTCHNGVNALGKPTVGHIPTSSQCDTCHSYQLTSFKPATMNHTGLTNQCSTCHNGNFVAQNALSKPSTHIPVTGQCDTCHVNTSNFKVWSPATMNHTGLTACSSCHSGTYLSQNAQIKPATHIATTAECSTCHTGTTTWATGVFNHATATPAVAGRCSTCHNGTNGIGKPSTHIPTTAQCDTCHTNQTAFKPAQMNHTGTGAQCSTCHNGSFLAMNALTKSPTHVVTTSQCDTCHGSTVSWTTSVAYVHAPTAYGQCSNCHNGTAALGKPGDHIPVGTQQCSDCHKNFVTFKPAQMAHINVGGTCSTCHNGNFVAKNALAKPSTHIVVTTECDTCHINGYVSWSPSVMNHTGLTACSTCHGGAFLSQNAQMKPTTHVATQNQCSTCHLSTTSWSTAVNYVHPTTVVLGGGGCSTCHNSTTALGKSTNHIPTTGQCDTCHATFVAFAPAAMNHTGTAGQCVTCHGGAFTALNAQIKSATHIPTTQSCDICHGTVAWKPTTYSHQGVVAGTCATCHNGTNATGKSTTGHIPTSAACDTCHTNYTAFAPAAMNHTGLAGQCATCHSGTFVNINAQKKTATHISTSAQCDTCHNSTTTWATGVFNHATASPAVTGRCSTCHNGTNALGLPTTHIPTLGGECDTCHTNTNAFKPAKMNHTGTTASKCSWCHSGNYLYANALAKPANHIPVSTQCDTCHKNGFVSWSPSTMDHTGLTQCTTCHNGSYLLQNAQSKPVTHQSTTAQCSSCHTSTTSWATATQNHAVLVPPAAGRCSTCHNSVTALGKSTNHIPTTGQCDTCHNTFTAFAPAAMNHTGTTGQCATCHSGAYTALNAQIKPATHIVTTASCDTCHGTVAWKPATYAHTGVTPGTCATCHNGTNALGKNATHIPVTASCDTCHTNYVAFFPAQMNHTGLNGKCSTCHSGAYVAVNAQIKSATHVSTTLQCDTCHTSTTTWANATFAHANPPGVCSTCHNGTTALGKPTTHIPTSAACDTCHTNQIAFKPASMNHTGLAGQCSTCHNGTYLSINALAKSASHIPVSSQCDTCHTKGFVTWSPSVMNHTGLTLCSTCHNGAYLSQNAQTKPVTHQVTSAQCSSCHSSTVSWATHTQDHSVLVPPATGRCSTCHNSVIAIGKSTNHIPTTGQCDTCHNNYTLFAPAVMNHTGTAGACISCHGGAYTTLNAQAKPATHMPTTQQCDYCHTTTLWKPTSFAHTAAQMGTNTCATCHNGTIASGKPAVHIPTTAACSVCHRTGISWLPLILPYAHTGIAAGTCSTCHLISYPSMSYKPASHLPTTAACDACHNKTAWTGTYTYNHLGVIAGTCDSCHVSQYTGLVVKPTNHMPYVASNKCDACHNTSTFATLTKTGASLHAMLTGIACYTCHDSSSTYLVTGAQKVNRSGHHGAGSKDCSSSGCHKPLGNQGSAYTKWN